MFPLDSTCVCPALTLTKGQEWRLYLSQLEERRPHTAARKIGRVGLRRATCLKVKEKNSEKGDGQRVEESEQMLHLSHVWWSEVISIRDTSSHSS